MEAEETGTERDSTSPNAPVRPRIMPFCACDSEAEGVALPSSNQQGRLLKGGDSFWDLKPWPLAKVGSELITFETRY